MSITVSLIQHLQQPGCDILLGRERLVFRLSSERAAQAFVRRYASILPLWLHKFSCDIAIIDFPNAKQPYRLPLALSSSWKRVMTTPPLIAAPGLQIAEMRLSLPIVRVLETFLEYPERKSALVRLEDERQMVISESAATLIKNATVRDAVQRKREDFWYLPDLEAFTLESQQQLEADNPDSILEFSWRGVDRTGQDWRRFTHRYRLVSDAYGTLYHVAENIGVEPSLQPTPVTA